MVVLTMRLLFLIIAAYAADPDLIGNVVEEAPTSTTTKFHTKEKQLTPAEARRVLEVLNGKDLAIITQIASGRKEATSESFVTDANENIKTTTAKVEITTATTSEPTATTSPFRVSPLRHHLFPNSPPPTVLNNRSAPTKEMLDLPLTTKLPSSPSTSIAILSELVKVMSDPVKVDHPSLQAVAALPTLTSNETHTVTPTVDVSNGTVTVSENTERPRVLAAISTKVEQKDSVVTSAPFSRRDDKFVVANREPSESELDRIAARPTSTTEAPVTEAPVTTTSRTEVIRTDAVKTAPKIEPVRKPNPPARRQQLRTPPQVPNRGSARSRAAHVAVAPRPQRKPVAQRQPEEPPLSILIIRNGRLLSLTNAQQRDLDVVIRSMISIPDAPVRRFLRNSP